MVGPPRVVTRVAGYEGTMFLRGINHTLGGLNDRIY